jgi:signal peptidase I
MIVSSREFMPVIRAALMRNQHVRLTTTGSSMYPIIRSGEVVELEPLRHRPGVGDLVLAQCPTTLEGERYVLHRIIRVQGEDFFLRGDAQNDCEGPFQQGDFLGRAIVVYRRGRAHRLDRGFWRHLGLAWNRCAPLNLWFFQIMNHLRRQRPRNA